MFASFRHAAVPPYYCLCRKSFARAAVGTLHATASTLNRDGTMANSSFSRSSLLKRLLVKPFSPAFTACLLLVAQSGMSGAQADTIYARPGRLVSAGAHRLNLYCMGSGSPTGVFHSGWGDWAAACA